MSDASLDPLSESFDAPPHIEVVGRIVLNWGSSDHILGLALEAVYRIRDQEAAADLLQVLDLKKKIDLLWKRRSRLPAHFEIEKIIKDIKKICENEKVLRDTLSHGIGLISPAGERVFYSGKSLKFVSEHELERAVLISRQLRILSKRLYVRAHGAEPHEPYPEIPNEQ